MCAISREGGHCVALLAARSAGCIYWLLPSGVSSSSCLPLLIRPSWAVTGVVPEVGWS